MTKNAGFQPDNGGEQAGHSKTRLTFVLDSNLGLPSEEKPWSDILAKEGIKTVSTDDLKRINAMVADHKPDIAYIPSADFLRLLQKGDQHYRGLAIATSKYSGLPKLKSLLVVRKDDEAQSLDDLEGEKYGYINRSCSSSYFPPAILLARQKKKLDDFLDITQVKPGPTWQGLVDAVVDGKVRATMILEDTWRSSPKNAETTKVIGEYGEGVAAIVAVRHDLDERVCATLLDALTTWTPPWQDEVYGAFKPYYYADVHAFFHDLEGLPKGV